MCVECHSRVHETFCPLVESTNDLIIFLYERILYYLLFNCDILNFQKIGASWALYNLAGLYWHVVGNHFQGIECIRRALYFVPDQYQDVPLLNLANILYRLGRVDDAISVMKDAISVNNFEVRRMSTLKNKM